MIREIVFIFDSSDFECVIIVLRGRNTVPKSDPDQGEESIARTPVCLCVFVFVRDSQSISKSNECYVCVQQSAADSVLLTTQGRSVTNPLAIS